jgi:hypothetical protein
MPTSAQKSVTMPVPVQVSELEFNPFILPHFLIPSFEAVLRDLKLATTSWAGFMAGRDLCKADVACKGGGRRLMLRESVAVHEHDCDRSDAIIVSRL